jgi:hypothetical protein
LFQPRQQQINGVSVKVEVRDGESRLNLNKIYQYVTFWARREQEIEKVSEKDEEKGNEDLSRSDKSKKEEDEAKKDRDRLKDILGPEMQTPDEEEEEEWVEPDAEQREAARRLIADAIINMVESNIGNGFVYGELYDADYLGGRIEEYVFERKAGDYQNFIFTTAELLQVEGVTHELYHGPLPPELLEPDMALAPGEEGYRRDEFGDVVYDFGLWGEEDPYFGGRSGFGGRGDLGGLGDLGDLGALGDLGDLDDLGALGRFGMGGGAYGGYGGYGGNRGFMQGMNSLAGTQYPDNEDGTGIIRSPEPIGLKHLFCTFSNGKVNLNTAPMEVLMALMHGGGDPNTWQNEDKLEVGLAIDEYRNFYTEEYLQELEDQELDYGAAYEEDPYLTGTAAYTGAEDMRTNYFKRIQDLEKIGDGELLSTSGVDSGSTERSLGWLVKKDLSPIAVFASEFFFVRVVALDEGFRQEAEFVVHRDTKKKMVSVVYYRERRD